MHCLLRLGRSCRARLSSKKRPVSRAIALARVDEILGSRIGIPLIGNSGCRRAGRPGLRPQEMIAMASWAAPF